MSRETAQALFDANRQRSHQADGESKGAGLALSNVLARIHLFFGPDSRIDVESTEGVGTKVTIILMGEPMELLMKEDRHVERTHS
jgi:two-component system sensor histidine kinase LytS